MTADYLRSQENLHSHVGEDYVYVSSKLDKYRGLKRAKFYPAAGWFQQFQRHFLEEDRQSYLDGTAPATRDELIAYLESVK